MSNELGWYAERNEILDDIPQREEKVHQSTFEFLEPSAEQKDRMRDMRYAAKNYAAAIEGIVPEGPDRTYVLRKLREVAMWVNIAITRQADGAPRE